MRQNKDRKEVEFWDEGISKQRGGSMMANTGENYDI